MIRADAAGGADGARRLAARLAARAAILAAAAAETRLRRQRGDRTRWRRAPLLWPLFAKD